MICAPLQLSWALARNRVNDLVDARHVDARWDGPGPGHSFGAVEGLAAGPSGAGPAFWRYPGGDLVDLAVWAGRPFTDTSQSAFARCPALGSARLPGGVEPVGEGGVAAACSGGADGLGQGAAGSGEDDEFPGAGDAGVEQVAPQHHPG